MTATRLGVWWWDGAHVADVDGDGADIRLSYTAEALDTWPANTPLLSCGLPVRSGSQQAGPFFRGVLPEGQQLAGVAAAAGLAVTDTTGLIARYGRDVAGALVIAPQFPGRRPGRLIAYSEETLAAEVTGLSEVPLALHEDSELSIAGLQDKLLLVATADGWSRPAEGAPSTHILKLDDRRHPGLVAAEAACLRLAVALGLTQVTVDEITLDGIDCIAVSRFDRIVNEDGTVARVHQEDLCQATRREPTEKYERAGGPTLRDAAELLDAYARDPLQELDRLVAHVTFTVLVGNADAHGKNTALLHGGDQVELAPLYDQVPTLMWPNLRRDAAVSIGPRVTGIDDIRADDIVAEARHWSHHTDRARNLVISLAERALAVVDATRHDQVRELVRTNAARLLGR